MRKKTKHPASSVSSIFIATFSHYEKGKRLPTNGMIEPLLSFLLPKVASVLLLDQPHPVSDSINPIVEIYNKGKIKKRFNISSLIYLPIYLLCKIPSKKHTRISYKIRDFLSVVFITFIRKDKYDLFIGLEGINACAGILLRKFGAVKTVIYYVSDYSPTRFGKTLFNSLYIWLDRFCVTHADFTWDVSAAMQEARLKSGLNPKKSYNVLHVPNALFPNQISSLPVSERTPNSLVYMGILDPDMGPDLAIRSMSEVIKKFHDSRLHVVGGTKEGVGRLRKLAKSLNLEKNITFYGFVQDNYEMASIVKSCMIGLAPYRSFPDSYRWYGDAGKIRQYLASGLPVVTTHVPPLGRFAAKNGAAIMTKDTVKDFSAGIIGLLSDRQLYDKLRVKAEKLSKENTWENVYTKTLKDMGVSLSKR